MPEVNFVEIVVAAVAAIILGFLWYGPIFGKTWMKLTGVTEAKIKEAKEKGMTKSYVLMMVGSLIMAYVLASFIELTGMVGAVGGATTGFWAWLGFAATVQSSKVLWGSDSWNLYFLETGYYLVSLLVMGAVMGSM
ncbi:DUF1761 domain-containing protein [Candidatus Daviesbacteria bacterium]|nr:DUF1761 domain-containing protein [Candidatus Daviesbacteria bacterium]